MKQSGFTLIEIMVVVVILGILAAIVVPRIVSRPDQAKVTKAIADIQNIGDALELYKLDNGFYPTTEQGLSALSNETTQEPIPENWHGYLKSVPIDPWGHQYYYIQPGEERDGKNSDYDLFSLGADNQEGGIDYNTDIGNWNLDKIKR